MRSLRAVLHAGAALRQQTSGRVLRGRLPALLQVLLRLLLRGIKVTRGRHAELTVQTQRGRVLHLWLPLHSHGASIWHGCVAVALVCGWQHQHHNYLRATRAVTNVVYLSSSAQAHKR